MREKQSLANQRIIDCLNTVYDINVAILTFLPLGADINASVYKALTPNQLSYFIKLQGQYQDISAALQELLHNAGIQQIISPVKTKHGQLTHVIDGFTLIVYPFIEGQDGFNQALTDDQWVILGKAMRQIHEFDLPLSIKDNIKRESYCPKWRDAVRLSYAHIDAGLRAPDDIASQLITFMKEHRKTIQQLVDRAEQLAQKLQQQSPNFVLCHSDLHGGNVLIAKDGTLYIVDWDHPIMAPKERDLMFIGGGVGNIWNNPHEQELFYKGYGKTEINRDILAYYRHERTVEDIADTLTSLLTTEGSKNREEMYKQFTDMFAPNGVVDIAFKTDTEQS